MLFLLQLEKTKLLITDIRDYVSIVTFSTQDNAKILEQLQFGFKRTINWNTSQSKVLTERQNQYLGFLIDSSFQGVNIHFVLLFENEHERKVNTGYYLLKVEMIDHNNMIDRKNFFNQPVKSNLRNPDNIQKKQLVKKMITQLLVYWIIIISICTIN